jgi:hypothetical protein
LRRKKRLQDAWKLSAVVVAVIAVVAVVVVVLLVAIVATCNMKFHVKHTSSMQLHYKQRPCCPKQIPTCPCKYNNFKETPATTLQTITLQSKTISSKLLQLHTTLQCKQVQQFQANFCNYNTNKDLEVQNNFM